MHIVINSLRVEEIAFLPHGASSAADTKANLADTVAPTGYALFQVPRLRLCHREESTSIDLLNGSKTRVTDRGIGRGRRTGGLDKRNAYDHGRYHAPPDKFETDKDAMRQTIRAALSAAASPQGIFLLLLRRA